MELVRKLRLLVQIVFTAVTNGYVFGFLTGKIYTGPLKTMCVPGLNCYSCPGALGSCPIGALQAVLTGGSNFSFYVAGFLLLFGSVLGRFVCGWLCPFGLVQDLLYKIPVPGKRKNLPAHRILTWLKYVILVVFVLLLPMFALGEFGQSKPWFCQYICPAGTLMAGLPLTAASEALREAAGALFGWKLGLLIFLVFLAVWIYRPFCKYICPLGAVYSFFNSIACYRYQVEDTCIGCGRCQEACGMDIRVWEQPNSPECIRCGECIRACPVHALRRERPENIFRKRRGKDESSTCGPKL